MKEKNKMLVKYKGRVYIELLTPEECASATEIDSWETMEPPNYGEIAINQNGACIMSISTARDMASNKLKLGSGYIMMEKSDHIILEEG